jgi:hypothetical protein
MWEYNAVYAKREYPRGNLLGNVVSGDAMDLLAKLGGEGWELVSSTPYLLQGTLQGETFYFKRPRKAQTTAS